MLQLNAALLPSSRNNNVQTFPAKVQLQLTIIFIIIIARYWYYCIFLRKCVGKQGFFSNGQTNRLHTLLSFQLLNSESQG